MILEELSLRNWRGYRDLHTFRFDHAFNLVTGRNEAGKSTLFEAMTRVLFDRHNSRAEEIRYIQPLGSSLGPEAELVFQCDGDRYKVCKRFLDQPVSKLFKERQGKWELDHEGDRADQHIRDILQGEAAGRASKPEHRGLAQALWYLQYEQGLPERSWSRSIKQGLAGLVQQVTESTDESRIFQSIEAVYSSDFTPTGRLAARSQLVELEREIQEDTQLLQELRMRSDHVESLRSDLEELTTHNGEIEVRLKQAQDDLKDLSTALEAANVLEQLVQQQREDVRVAEEEFRKLSEGQNSIERRAKDIEECNHALKDALSTFEDLEADARQERIAVERHHNNWKEEYEPRLQTFEQNLRILQALERLRNLTRSKARLESHLAMVRDIQDKLRAGNQRLASLHAPTDKELNQFQTSLGDLRVLEAQVESSAIRVSFTLDDKDALVEAEPQAQRSTGDEFLVTVPTLFTIQGVGAVNVKGGGSSIEELNARALELRAKIDDTMLAYGADGPQALSDLYQQRVDLEAENKRLQGQLDTLAEQEPDQEPEQELARVEAGIREESQVSRSAPDEWKEWGGQRIRERASNLEDEKTRLIGLIEEEQSHETRANDTHLKQVREAQEASNRVSGLKSRIGSIEQENAEAVKTYGTLENLKRLVAQSKGELQEAEDDLNSSLENYESQVELPRRLYDQGLESVKRLENQLRQIADDMVDRRARIEEAAAQGLYSQTADLEGALQSKTRRLDSLRRRADAAKLLWDMIGVYRQQQSAALVGPVAMIVSK